MRRTFVLSLIRRHAPKLTAALIILVVYGFTRLPELSETERLEMAARFGFTEFVLPGAGRSEMRSVRAVHPSMEHISAWISSVGASVALNDLDGDGLSNDVCYVEVRTDEVVVAPVPGTPSRYPAFTLDPSPLPYDHDTTAPMGCLPGDLNEDGRTDLLVYFWGRTPIAYLRRAGYARPSAAAYAPVEISPRIERWNSNAATRADLDGDGHVDLILGNYFQDGARILDAQADGVEQMQHSMSRAFNAGRNRILLWTGASAGEAPTVTFEDRSDVLDEQLLRGWTLAVGTADLDGDLLPEIYFANDFGPDRLLHNRTTAGVLDFAVVEGRKDVMTPSSKVLGRDSFKGMGVDFGDVNGDGLLDIYVSNIADNYALHESHFLFVSTGDVERLREGRAPYRDQSEPLGVSRSDWGWEARLADFDNDGTYEALQATGFVKGETNRWPELQELATGNDELLAHVRVWPRIQPGDDLSGNAPNRFFVRSESGRYFDLASELGLAAPHITRAIATADVDGDGDLDFALGNQWEPSLFYRNDGANTGKHLGLRLLLPVADDSRDGISVIPPEHPSRGIPAIGASASVHMPDGRVLVAQVDGGNGHSGARSHDLHFGLGNVPDDRTLAIDLAWRDRGGHVREARTHLVPGRHTVLLY